MTEPQWVADGIAVNRYGVVKAVLEDDGCWVQVGRDEPFTFDTWQELVAWETNEIANRRHPIIEQISRERDELRAQLLAARREHICESCGIRIAPHQCQDAEPTF